MVSQLQILLFPIFVANCDMLSFVRAPISIPFSCEIFIILNIAMVPISSSSKKNANLIVNCTNKLVFGHFQVLLELEDSVSATVVVAKNILSYSNTSLRIILSPLVYTVKITLGALFINLSKRLDITFRLHSSIASLQGHLIVFNGIGLQTTDHRT